MTKYYAAVRLDLRNHNPDPTSALGNVYVQVFRSVFVFKPGALTGLTDVRTGPVMRPIRTAAYYLLIRRFAHCSRKHTE